MLWMSRNAVEVNKNNDGDGKYTAILHARIAGKVRGVTRFEPQDVVRGHVTARNAIQDLCNRNNLLSPWDIRSLKMLANHQASLLKSLDS